MAKTHVLLISEATSCDWIDLLRQSVEQLGRSLKITQKTGVSDPLAEMFIIDAPGKSTAELSEMVNAIHSEADKLPIVVISPLPEYREAVTLARAGASDYTPKPAAKEDILGILKKYLKSHSP